MNVSGFIKNLKTKMREQQDKRVERVKTNQVVLEKERARLEEQKKVYDAQSRERARVNALKKEVRSKQLENNAVYRVGKQITQNMSEHLKNVKKKEAPSFMKSGAGMFGEQAKSPWALQRDAPATKPKTKLKSKKKIIVYYQ